MTITRNWDPRDSGSNEAEEATAYTTSKDRLFESAFTLVELLVVIAILLILVAIRWPAMGHTRNQAQTAVDIYNNRQLMAAANMYAADQQESLPGNGWGTDSDCWAHAANLPLYFPVTAANFSTALSNQVEFCKRGQLYAYLLSPKIFKCPNDLTNQLYFQRNIYFSSYLWNGAVCGYGNYVTAKGQGSYKITQFRPNSILQWEADDQAPFFFNDCSAFPDETISGRHGPAATVGLISGGTQRISLKVWFSSAYAGSQQSRGGGIPASSLPNPAWCNPGVRSGLQY